MALEGSASEKTAFERLLFDRLTQLNAGVAALDRSEFNYALESLDPAQGWDAIQVPPLEVLENLIRQPGFFQSIELKPKQDDRIVLDKSIVLLNQWIFKGLVSGVYPPAWVDRHFYFDIRAFSFFVRTQYFTAQFFDRFGQQPYRQFSARQQDLAGLQDIGYPEFSRANLEVDAAFLEVIQTLIARAGTPLLLALVGPSAAGKSEITARLQQALSQSGRNSVTIEMDNFFKDRSYRDGKPVDTRVIHFDLFKKSIHELLNRQKTVIPRYDFVLATSSHDLLSQIRPNQSMIPIEPADIILLEGNFPFHIPEINPLISIRAVYLTDDPIRLKRKWRRDVDYRKKYAPAYLCNRFFRTQLFRAQQIYQPMMEASDVVVDTTAAALWVAPEHTAAL